MVADNEPQTQESADFLEHCLIASIMKATAEVELNGFNSPEEYRKVIMSNINIRNFVIFSQVKYPFHQSWNCIKAYIVIA